MSDHSKIPRSAEDDYSKEIVEQRAGPAACYQRLLFRGKDLADDALTLVAAGLQPRTKLMLRLNEQYAAPREAAPPTSATQTDLRQAPASTYPPSP